jgi:predicted RNase H-like nuclease (RuvC/YqgF family)
MDVPVPTRALEALAELREELEGELDALEERRSELERELEGLSKDIESKRRMLELLETTAEDQLAAQGREEQGAMEGDGPGASTEVRGLDQPAYDISESRVAHLGLASVLSVSV